MRNSPTELVSFQSARNESGYEICTGIPHEGPDHKGREPDAPAPGQEEFAEPYVVEHPEGRLVPAGVSGDDGVFHVFADAEVSPQAMLALVHEYGFLGPGERVWVNGKERRGERLTSLLGFAERSREARKLWWATEGRADVRSNFRMDGRELWYVAEPESWQKSIEGQEEWMAGNWSPLFIPEELTRHSDPFLGVFEAVRCGEAELVPPAHLIATQGTDSEYLVADFKSGALRRVAAEALAIAINQQLDPEVYDTPTARPRVVSDHGKLSLHLVPPTLEAFLWLQFAQEVSGARQYRKCESCPKWFAVTEHTRRTRRDRKYCSDACKTRAYRSRKDSEEES